MVRIVHGHLEIISAIKSLAYLKNHVYLKICIKYKIELLDQKLPLETSTILEPPSSMLNISGISGSLAFPSSLVFKLILKSISTFSSPTSICFEITFA